MLYILKHVKYSQARKELKNVLKSKMQSILFDDSNPHTLTKKFWSYVKSSSTSSRVPEQVHHNSIHANKSHDKANLLNTFFFNQFSPPSKYDIDINFGEYQYHNFRFDAQAIFDILRNIDINKAPGPDGIAGIILKKCSKNLAYSLSILYNIYFSTG